MGEQIFIISCGYYRVSACLGPAVLLWPVVESVGTGRGPVGDVRNAGHAAGRGTSLAAGGGHAAGPMVTEVADTATRQGRLATHLWTAGTGEAARVSTDADRSSAATLLRNAGTLGLLAALSLTISVALLLSAVPPLLRHVAIAIPLAPLEKV